MAGDRPGSRVHRRQRRLRARPRDGRRRPARRSSCSSRSARSHGIRLSLASSLLAPWADGRPAIGSPSRPPPTRPTASRRSRWSGRGAPPTPDGVVARGRAQPGAVGYRLDGWDGAAPPPESVHEVLRAVARDRAAAARADRADFGVGERHRRGDGRARDPGRAPRRALHAHRRRPGGRRPLPAPPPRDERDGPLPGDRDRRRARSAPSGCCSGPAVRLGPPHRRSARCSLASIPDDAKRAILGGNAARLFGLADGPVDLTTDRRSRPARSTSTRTSGRSTSTSRRWTTPTSSASCAVRGPRPAVASAAIAIFGDPVRGNAQTVRAAAAGHGDGLHGYVVADPTDLDSSADQLRRYLDAPGRARGEGPRRVERHADGRPCDDATCSISSPASAARSRSTTPGDGWDDALARDRTPASAPADRDRPRRPRDAERGGRPRRGRARQRPPRVVEQLRQPARRSARRSRIAGPDRLLWGSDAPLLDPAFVLGTYLDAGSAAGRARARLLGERRGAVRAVSGRSRGPRDRWRDRHRRHRGSVAPGGRRDRRRPDRGDRRPGRLAAAARERIDAGGSDRRARASSTCTATPTSRC